MGSLLDWVTHNSWAVALVAVVFAGVGYAVTRPVALRGSSSGGTAGWVAFCMALYPDTRKPAEDDGEGEPPGATDMSDGGGGTD